MINLEDAGLTIDIAENGLVAIEQVKKNQYDIIFMDCQMPVMDGYSAAKAIRKLNDSAAKVPIIALTANAMEGEEQKCLDAGMNSYISKPFEFEDIIDKLNDLLPEFKEIH